MPRNPLKRLDSDERIQGNPRKSNTSERGLRSKTATRQENPNGATGPKACPADVRGRQEPALLKELHRVDQGSVNAPQQRDADETPGQRQLEGGGGVAAPVVKAHDHPLKPPQPCRRPSPGPYDDGHRPP